MAKLKPGDRVKFSRFGHSFTDLNKAVNFQDTYTIKRTYAAHGYIYVELEGIHNISFRLEWFVLEVTVGFVIADD